MASAESHGWEERTCSLVSQEDRGTGAVWSAVWLLGQRVWLKPGNSGIWQLCLGNCLLWNRDSPSWLWERHSCLLEASGLELGCCGHCTPCCTDGSLSPSASCCILSFPYGSSIFDSAFRKKYCGFQLWGTFQTLCTNSLLLSSKSWLTPPLGAEEFGAGSPRRQSSFF